MYISKRKDVFLLPRHLDLLLILPGMLNFSSIAAKVPLVTEFVLFFFLVLLVSQGHELSP